MVAAAHVRPTSVYTPTFPTRGNQSGGARSQMAEDFAGRVAATSGGQHKKSLFGRKEADQRRGTSLEDAVSGMGGNDPHVIRT